MNILGMLQQLCLPSATLRAALQCSSPHLGKAKSFKTGVNWSWHRPVLRSDTTLRHRAASCQAQEGVQTRPRPWQTCAPPTSWPPTME